MIKLGIGRKLRDIRKEHGYTQGELAQVLGVSNKTISSWESDRTEPTIGIIERLASLYGMNKSDLVSPRPREIVELPDDAIQLLDMYTNASPEVQQAVKTLLYSATYATNKK